MLAGLVAWHDKLSGRSSRWWRQGVNTNAVTNRDLGTRKYLFGDRRAMLKTHRAQWVPVVQKSGLQP